MPCQLFVRPLSLETLGQQTTPPSCLNIKPSFHFNGLILLPEHFEQGASLLPHIPTSHLLHPLTHTSAHTHPSHCCYNGFTRCWPCSNEVWSFCAATGKLSCGTVLFILVHLLRCYTPLIYLLILAHSLTSIGKIKPNLYIYMKKANNWETICPNSVAFAAVVLGCTNSQFNHLCVNIMHMLSLILALNLKKSWNKTMMLYLP